MKNTEFKKVLDDLGMQMISSHCEVTKDFERKAAEAAEIGMKYLICPYKGAQKSLDNYKQFSDEFNACGEITKKMASVLLTITTIILLYQWME